MLGSAVGEGFGAQAAPWSFSRFSPSGC